MDKRIKQIIDEKLDFVIGEKGLKEIQYIVNAMPFVKDKQEFGLGLMIGRVYNAFHYQTRRILKRDATKEEFEEFVALLEERIEKIRDVIKI